MDDSTKKIALTLLSGFAKKAAITICAGLTTHGLTMTGNSTEIVASAIVGLTVWGYSMWNDYGKAIVLSKLAVYKAQALAQADKLNQHGLSQPSDHEVAVKDPALSVKDVAKVVSIVLVCMFVVTSAFAQSPKPRMQLPIDPLGLNNRVGTGSPLNDLLGALDAKLLPDLQYALKLAQASGSKVTAPCYSAWIDIINTRTKAVEDGTSALALPDPHIVTDFEKLVELRNSLQPDSPFMIACSPVASMVKKDILGFIGTVLSGGAGLATLVPGL